MSNSSEGESMTWWEKDVEWKFVGLMVKNCEVHSRPLSGASEKALGDCLSEVKNARMAIVEFKRNYVSSTSEKKKYSEDQKAAVELIEDNYVNARTILHLHPSAAAHVIIYGDSFDDGELKLKAAKYWGAVDRDNEYIKGEDIIEILGGIAIPKVEIFTYLRCLADLRFTYLQGEDDQGENEGDGKDGNDGFALFVKGDNKSLLIRLPNVAYSLLSSSFEKKCRSLSGDNSLKMQFESFLEELKTYKEALKEAIKDEVALKERKDYLDEVAARHNEILSSDFAKLRLAADTLEKSAKDANNPDNLDLSTSPNRVNVNLPGLSGSKK